MEFFQYATFTAFLAVILCFLAAKIVSFAVSNSCNAHSSSVCAAVTKEVSISKGLRVKTTKSKKSVNFVDDVKVKSVDRCDGKNWSESLVLLDDWESKNEDENCVERIEQSEEKGMEFCAEMGCSKKDCFDVREINDVDDPHKESENAETIVEKDGKDDEMDVVMEEKGLIIEEPKNEIVLEQDEMEIDKCQEKGVVGFGENEGSSSGDVVKPRDDDDVVGDDDWEGIERSELEKVFAEAVNFVEYGGKRMGKDDDQLLGKLGGDKKMQLYGLHKVAVEGPCREPQPMALMVSSRAKWNAWHKLGNMSPEKAMEEYIGILSESLPQWMHEYFADTDPQDSSTFKTAPDLDPVLRFVPECKRKLEHNATDIGDSIIGPSYVENVTTDSAKE